MIGSYVILSSEYGLNLLTSFYWIEHSSNNEMSFLRLGYKRLWLQSLVLSLAPSWITWFGGRQLPVPEATLHKGPHKWAWKWVFWYLPAAMGTSHFLEADPPPGKALKWLQNQPTPQQQPLKLFWVRTTRWRSYPICDLQKLCEIINVCCFLPLGFRVICYRV